VRRRRTVDAVSNLPAGALRRRRPGYDAYTMRLQNAFPVSLLALLAALVAVGLPAAAQPVNVALIRVTAAGPDAVRVAGTIAGAHQLEAVLYVRFAPELPNVFLTRRPIVTDAGGNFDAIVAIAPAYYTGAIVTVDAQTSAAVTVGRGTMTIADPSGSQ